MNHWFSKVNHVQDGTLSASSSEAGVVSYPSKTGTGSAAMYTGGIYSGAHVKTFTVEISSTAGGAEIGQALFRWKHSDSISWEGENVATSTSWIALDDGVQIKFAAGAGDDFALGDTWTFVCETPFGVDNLKVLNRDQVFRSGDLDDPNWIQADLGDFSPYLSFYAPIEEDIDPDLGFGLGSFNRSDQVYRQIESGGYLSLVASAVARFEQRSGLWGLLLEGTRTNRILYSDDLTKWVHTNTSTIWQSQINYMGTSGIVGVVLTTTSGLHDNYIIFSSVQVGEKYIAQCKIKDGSRPHWLVGFYVRNASGTVLSGYAAYFDLSTGNITHIAGTSATLELISTGYNTINIFASSLPASANDGYIRFYPTSNFGADPYFPGDGSTVAGYVGGVQLEWGVVATSLIPTSGIPVARQTEDAKMVWGRAKNFYDQAGMAYIEWHPTWNYSGQPTNSWQNIFTPSENLYYGLAAHRDAGGNGYIIGSEGTNWPAVALSWAARTWYPLILQWWTTSAQAPPDATKTPGMRVGVKVGSTWSWSADYDFAGSFPAGAYLKLHYGASWSQGSYPARYRNFRLYSAPTMTKAAIEGASTISNLDQTAQVDAVILLDHNLTSGASVSLQAQNHDYRHDDWTSADFSQALSFAEGAIAAFVSQAYRFWRLRANDPDNPAGYVEASELFLGTGMTPRAPITTESRAVDMSDPAAEPRETFDLGLVVNNSGGRDEFTDWAVGLLSRTRQRVEPFYYGHDVNDLAGTVKLVDISDSGLKNTLAGKDGYEIPIQMVEARRTAQ